MLISAIQFGKSRTALFLKAPELLAELAAATRRRLPSCSVGPYQLGKFLQSSAAGESVEAPGAESPPDEPSAPRGPVWSERDVELGVTPIVLNPEAPQWDSNGYRLNPSRSVFPRQKPYLPRRLKFHAPLKCLRYEQNASAIPGL